jgi:myo-inositol-1(or 4)-monophosphatase
VEQVPGMREEFERVGGGAVLNNSPYDLAAAALIASEAGAVVSDAAGEPFDERPLLGSGAEFQMSVAIASNRALHEQLVNEVASGLARLRAPSGDAKTPTKP